MPPQLKSFLTQLPTRPSLLIGAA